MFVLFGGESECLQNDAGTRMSQDSLWKDQKLKFSSFWLECQLTHPSVMKGMACFAITWRLSSSLRKKVFPRFNIMLFTSSIVLSSNFGEANVMKQINSALAEHTEVIGLPLFLSIVTADSIDFTISWMVETKNEIKKIMKECWMWRNLTVCLFQHHQQRFYRRNAIRHVLVLIDDR